MRGYGREYRGERGRYEEMRREHTPWFARGTVPDRAWYGGPHFGTIGNPPEPPRQPGADRYDAGYGRGGDRRLRPSAGRYDGGFQHARAFRPGERWPR